MAGGGGPLGFSKDFTIMVVKDYAEEERKKINFQHYFFFPVFASYSRNLMNSNTNIANMLSYCRLSQSLIVLLNRFSQEQNQKFAT